MTEPQIGIALFGLFSFASGMVLLVLIVCLAKGKDK